MSATTTPHPVPPTVTPERIAFYRRNGFVHIPNIITKDEAIRFRQAALDAAGRMTSLHQGDIFTQLVNVWREDPAMKPLTFHPHLAAAAVALAGVKLRLWHDHILIKKPHNKAPTEFHQDQPYWPHADSTHPISAWIALCDVPVERGCMTFIPESQKYTDLPPQNLADDKSLMTLCPPLQWEPRVTVPLRAGDCTFHHGRCAHMATPNFTDDPRVAHVVIFVDENTTYAGHGHCVTDPLDLRIGQTLPDDMCPPVDLMLN